MAEIETRLFRHFVVLAEEQHFSRAALRLKISPPTLTHQIKKLREPAWYQAGRAQGRAERIWLEVLSHEGVAVFVSEVDAQIIATCADHRAKSSASRTAARISRKYCHSSRISRSRSWTCRCSWCALGSLRQRLSPPTSPNPSTT